jgi:hypothetical protein
MGRAKLPEARIEPRGVEGHLAKLRAEAREGTRVAGKIGVGIARILGWTAFAGGAVAILAMLAPPPRTPQLDEIRRIQADFQRQQLNLEATQRALDTWQSQQNLQLMQDLQRVQSMPVPTYPTDIGVYQPSPSYDWSNALPPLPETTPAPTTNARAAKEAHAAERAQAIEAKRAQRTR